MPSTPKMLYKLYSDLDLLIDEQYADRIEDVNIDIFDTGEGKIRVNGLKHGVQSGQYCFAESAHCYAYNVYVAVPGGEEICGKIIELVNPQRR